MCKIPQLASEAFRPSALFTLLATPVIAFAHCCSSDQVCEQLLAPETLVSMREGVGLGQAELARRLDKTAALVNKWERGARLPSDEQWKHILHVFAACRAPQRTTPGLPGAKHARTRKRTTSRELTERIALGKHLRQRWVELGRTRYRAYLNRLQISFDTAEKYIRLAQRFGSDERLERLMELHLPMKR